MSEENTEPSKEMDKEANQSTEPKAVESDESNKEFQDSLLDLVGNSKLDDIVSSDPVPSPKKQLKRKREDGEFEEDGSDEENNSDKDNISDDENDDDDEEEDEKNEKAILLNYEFQNDSLDSNEWVIESLSPESLKKFLKFASIILDGDVTFCIRANDEFTGIFIESKDSLGINVISARLKCRVQIKGKQRDYFNVPIKSFTSIVNQAAPESTIFIYKLAKDPSGFESIRIHITDKENNPSFSQSSRITLKQDTTQKSRLKGIDVNYNMVMNTHLLKSICKFGKENQVEAIKFQLLEPCKKQKGPSGEAVKTIICKIDLESQILSNSYMYINQMTTRKVGDSEEKVVEISPQNSIVAGSIKKGKMKWNHEYYATTIYKIVNENKDPNMILLFSNQGLVINIPFANSNAQTNESYVRFIIPHRNDEE